MLGIEHKEDISTSLTASSGEVVIEMTDLEHDISMVSASLTDSRVSQGAHARFRIDVIDTGILVKLKKNLEYVCYVFFNLC